jgi:(p)ppGpp synthase/HD superfamily hydrolase
MVKVNGKAAGIDSRLQDGDSIEIITGDKLKTRRVDALSKRRTMTTDQAAKT